MSLGGVGSALVAALTAGAFAVVGPSFFSARLVMIVALVAMVALAAVWARDPE